MKPFRLTAAALALTLCVAAIVWSTIAQEQPASKPAFSCDVTTKAKPWTHLNFPASGEDFRFAVAADRSGGIRPGVFASAMKKLNAMQPDFVVSVGDFIRGVTTNPIIYNEEYEQFEAELKVLDAPFFRTPGNHDITNAVLQKEWEKRFGVRYYSFVYKDVLFMVLDSEEDLKNRGLLSPAQRAWAKKTLADHPRVRWTFVLMHKPLWMVDDKAAKIADPARREAAMTGFQEVEKALADRPYTVIVGHWHIYNHYKRNGRDYYVLGTTGGESNLSGPESGQFDHVMWITMRRDRPHLVNLTLEGIVPHDVVNDRTRAAIRSSGFTHAEGTFGKGPVTVASGATNPYDVPMTVTFGWEKPAGCTWTVPQEPTVLTLEPGQSKTVSFRVESGDKPFPHPWCNITYDVPGTWHMTHRRTVDLDRVLEAYRPTFKATRVQVAPTVDGRLDDAAWADVPVIDSFRRVYLDEPSVPTRVRVSTDGVRLYVAWECMEPNIDRLLMYPAETKRPIWSGDCVELFVDPGADGKDYTHIMVDPAGRVESLRNKKAAADLDVAVAASIGKSSWTVELSVPLKAMGIDSVEGAGPVGVLFARSRHAGTRETLQCPPLRAWNHRTEYYGRLEF